jgi:hypothetical protein
MWFLSLWMPCLRHGKRRRIVKGYKGFDKNLQCRGKQYAIGQTFEEEDAVLCRKGIHFFEYPLDCFRLYSPGESRFAEIEAENVSDETSGEGKRVAKKITVKGELSLKSIIEAAVKFTFDMADWSDDKNKAAGVQGAASATGDRGAAFATGVQGAASAAGDRGAAFATGDYGAASAAGDRGAASATGYRGAASAAGDYGAASAAGVQGAAFAAGDYGAASVAGVQGAAFATGYYGAASAAGVQGAASATGYYGAASVKGENSVAMATGVEGKAAGSLGCWIVLAEWVLDENDDWRIKEVKSVLVDGEKIKPDTFYMLENGDFVEAVGGA